MKISSEFWEKLNSDALQISPFQLNSHVSQELCSLMRIVRLREICLHNQENSGGLVKGVIGEPTLFLPVMLLHLHGLMDLPRGKIWGESDVMFVLLKQPLCTNTVASLKFHLFYPYVTS